MSNITNKPMSGPLPLQAGGTFQTSTDANLATIVGTRWDLSDGRELILGSTSSTTTATAGQLYQDAALVANHNGLTVTTVTAYSSNGNVPASVAVTLGATALTANQYQGGFLQIQSGAGLGQILRVAENPVALASATNITITLEDGWNVLPTTSSTVGLIPAHGANVIQMPTTASNVPVGVALAPIAPSSYGFFVSKGITTAISDAKVATVGQGISPSVTTAGTVTVALTNATGASLIGYAGQNATSAQASLVFVNM